MNGENKSIDTESDEKDEKNPGDGFHLFISVKFSVDASVTFAFYDS